VKQSPTSSGPDSTAPDPARSALPLERLLTHAAACVMGVRQGRSLNDLLAGLPAEARPGSQALAFHALRWMGGADAARLALVPRRPAPAIEGLLLVALALLWPGAGAPYEAHTVVDQAVTAARRESEHATRFINGVLRRFLREREALVEAWAAHDPVVRYQHPRWWIDTLRRDWPLHWQTLLAQANRQAPMVLRVNRRQVSPHDYLDELGRVGLGARLVRLTWRAGAHEVSAGEGEGEGDDDHALVLDRAVPVQALPGFATGRVSVQDLSAQMAAPLLLGQGADALRPGAHVLDACAAPGGKSAHLLELADLDLLALDSDAKRLDLARATLQRLGLVARVQQGDAGQPSAWWDGRRFDAILLDAPCSASGIVRRHPDIRWLRRAGDISALGAIQARLLDALWPLLAPGGRLVYATCSIFGAEGRDQAEAFLQRTTDAIERPAPGHVLPLTDNDGDPGDGFFYARLDKLT
jgi:16S rRNA (cytosine967-C5)-methyltransferase